MNLRRMLIPGVVFLLLGFAAGLYLGIAVIDARVEGAFSTLASDSPSNQFGRFRCPVLLNEDQTATVAVTISNPTDEPLDYAVRIQGHSLTVLSPGTELQISIPGGQSAEMSWTVAAVERGKAAVSVEALSSKDSALPGPFHGWPTSFREGRGILVIAGALAGRQVVLLCLAVFLIGTVLASLGLYGHLGARLRKRQSAIDEPPGRGT